MQQPVITVIEAKLFQPNGNKLYLQQILFNIQSLLEPTKGMGKRSPPT